MPDGNGFFPPMQYSPLWMILGWSIVLLVIAWFVLVPLLTRARPVPSEGELRARAAALTRKRYAELIDDVESAYARSELSNRAAHQRLSALVRGFAHEYSGYPASSMTLTELRALSLPGLTSTIERFYPVEFGTEEAGSVPAALRDARHVVLDWSAPV